MSLITSLHCYLSYQSFFKMCPILIQSSAMFSSVKKVSIWQRMSVTGFPASRYFKSPPIPPIPRLTTAATTPNRKTFGRQSPYYEWNRFAYAVRVRLLLSESDQWNRQLCGAASRYILWLKTCSTQALVSSFLKRIGIVVLVAGFIRDTEVTWVFPTCLLCFKGSLLYLLCIHWYQKFPLKYWHFHYTKSFKFPWGRYLSVHI